MESFRNKIKEFSRGRNAKGCLPHEIDSLESLSGIDLPDAYRQFLLVAGHGMDDYLSGSDYTLDELNGTREAADDLLVSAGLQPLPSEAFVFAMHQGYQFYFFLNGEVYYFGEGMDHIQKRFSSFESFFDSVTT